MKSRHKTARLMVAIVMATGSCLYFSNEINAQGRTYKIGDRGPAGGWIFYDKGEYSDGWRYLEAASEDQSNEASWGCCGKSIPGAQGIAIGTGKKNTAAIVKGCRDTNIAAKIAVAYRGGGKSDWFLPSREELNLMYVNLHKARIGGFADDLYWSSTEPSHPDEYTDYGAFGDDYADYQRFNDGYPLSGKKDNDYLRVRAIRAF